jgi:DNA replication and repair protein RecF
VAFAGDANVLVGPNGAGKTNVLEAIYYLALARSPRAARDGDLVRANGQGFRILGDVGSGTVEARYEPMRGRTLAVNGRPCARAADLYGQLTAVFFSPDDLWLAKGGPGGRRRLLDGLLLQARPAYAALLAGYEEALAQRNALLREIRARRSSAALLEIWDESLVEYGVGLAERRARAVEAVAAEARAAYAFLAAGEGLTCRYASGIGARWEAEAYRAALAAARREELERGFTVVGPHRDDVILEIDGRPLRGFASQGQQRTAVLALRLAERAALRRATGREPVLLLDDVLSELDEARRRGLADLLAGGGQVFLTATDAEGLPEGFRASLTFRVGAGRVSPLAAWPSAPR